MGGSGPASPPHICRLLDKKVNREDVGGQGETDGRRGIVSITCSTLWLIWDDRTLNTGKCFFFAASNSSFFHSRHTVSARMWNVNSVTASLGPVVTLAQTPLKNVTHVGEGGGPGALDGRMAARRGLK